MIFAVLPSFICCGRGIYHKTPHIWLTLLLVSAFDLVGCLDWPWGGWRHTLGCRWRGKRGIWGNFLQRGDICCSWSLGISEFFLIYYVVDKPCLRESSLLFTFSFLILFSIISHHSELWFFCSGVVDSRVRI